MNLRTANQTNPADWLKSQIVHNIRVVKYVLVGCVGIVVNLGTLALLFTISSRRGWVPSAMARHRIDRGQFRPPQHLDLFGSAAPRFAPGSRVSIFRGHVRRGHLHYDGGIRRLPRSCALGGHKVPSNGLGIALICQFVISSLAPTSAICSIGNSPGPKLKQTLRRKPLKCRSWRSEVFTRVASPSRAQPSRQMPRACASRRDDS